MDRFLPLDVTLQTLGAHLYPDEHILTHADSVGLYDAKDKSPRHADGRAILTSHRVVFVSSSRPHANSAYLPLSLVRQTEYWAGFLKSSPKITLLLAERQTSSSSSSGAAQEGAAAAAGDRDGERERDKTREALALAALAGERNWVCRVCGMHNVPTAQLGLKCSLCGVTRDPTPSSSSSSRPPPPPPPAASSAPPSRFGTPPPPPRPPRPDAPPSSAPVALDPTETGARLACPVCTFLNHHSMTRCEVCDSVLLPPSPPRPPPSSTSLAHSAPHSRSNSTRSLAPSRSGTPGPGTDPASAAPVSVPIAGSGSSATAAQQAQAAFVRLSFRKGGEKAFYAALKEAMGAKAWDLSAAALAGAGKGGKGGRGGKGVEGKGAEGESEGSRGVGIDAILRGVDLDARDREDSLDDALKDLESLMRKAKDMITLAQSINAQLASSAASPSNGSSTSPTPAAAARAASLASSSLHSLGLATASSSVLDNAVTPDLVADDRAYHAELARELDGVLEKGRVMERKGGIVGLDEVWCLWNRARGVARLTLRVFHPSGLTILHTPRFAPRAFESRVLDLVDTRQALVASLALGGPQLAPGQGQGRAGDKEEGGTSAAAEAAEREGASLLDIAHAEGLSVGLAKELLGVLELGERGGAGGGGASAGGAVVRDEQAGEGTRWYRNWISGAVWDGQEF
ncbi:uncharacterized protein RHOBADRAFT_47352 [Rhodotorula graminis WP1]|uniref:Vacuolar protein-sorting-associated protein 36 n=1 Tax=Rhodotorula graminis (strain WP1) TaxID=578459 RepID=A0A0N8PZC0_RHOGW|nr:uncharacterized protein RHOBADRAFT_47352 [Rhodotorula graminis WP1]KPV71901.1 hypothetical protein RHOBADRAFT_47352 [Rhodotorula graminis WP1]